MPMPTHTSLPSAALLLVLSLGSIPAFGAETDRFAIDAHFGTMLADGVPANDMPGYGIAGRYRLNDLWSLGLGYYRTEFDYEEPARRLGIPLDPDDPPVDAKATMDIISVFVERSFTPPQADRELFLGAAAAIAFTDVPDVTGPTASGGTFDIRTEVDREVIASLFGGIRQRFGERWFWQFTLRADQHFAAWEPEDRISGATGRHENYFAYGGHLGIGYRF